MKKSTIAKFAALSALAIAAMAVPAAAEAEVRNVVYIVNGNLGDKSFFDSAEAGLKQLKEKHYGEEISDKKLIRVAIVISQEKRALTKWQMLD